MEEIEQRAAQSAQERDTAPARPDRRRSAPARAEPVEAEESIALRVRLVEWVARHRNPLIFAGVGLLIVATVALRQWRQHRQELPRIAELGRVDGLAALDEGEFDKAYQLLSRARSAVDALGGAVEGASQIRQGAAEAEIFVQLVPDRLETILGAAGRSDPKEWPSQFSSLYKGRSVIIDAHVIAIPDASGHGRYELDYQILPDGEGKAGRVARLDLTGLRLFEATHPKVGDQVTFGARLASFDYDEHEGEWRVGLERQSGVFLTHAKALAVLGWPSGSDVAPREGDEP
jgi:hypothetical protein